MTLTHELAAELALVKKDRGEGQLSLFKRNMNDAVILGLHGETFENVIKVLENREGPGVVRAPGMRKAINREFGGWRRFCQMARAGAFSSSEPPVRSAPRTAGIVDDRISDGREEWRVK
jgi:hypothetical protein